MMDLPTSVWAGRGWSFDDNGLRRLSSTGGSHAMKGTEVFESVGSVGAAREEVKPSDKAIKEPSDAVAAKHPPPLAAEKKPTRFLRQNVGKQSGIPNVKWDRTLMA